MIESPYKNFPEEEWTEITEKLVSSFPINKEEIVLLVKEAWHLFYTSTLGGLSIGKDIFLPAQATGVIIEKLIANILHAKYPTIWQGGIDKNHKDIINIENSFYSFEIKTSSSSNGIYGNRSTGFRSVDSRKIRTGYYLAINYLLPTETNPDKKIIKIRFGWIDDDDWVGQKESSGQQASISSQKAKLKLLTLFQG